MAERRLDIQIRLTENAGANNALLRGLEQRIKAAVNPPASATNSSRLVPPILALQVAAATSAQNKIREIREKLSGDLLRIHAKTEADEARHQRRLEELAVQGAQRRARTSSNAFLRNASVIREAGESLQFAGGFFSSAGGNLLSLGERAAQAAGQVESVNRAFTQLDKGAAPQTLVRLRTQADSLKVAFVDYAEQVNRVRATQKLTADGSEKLVQGLINVGRAVGATREQQDRAVTALNQILSKGKVTSEELRGQLLEAIPNLAPIIEKRFKTLDAEVLEKKFGTRKFVGGLIEELSKLPKLDATPLEKFQASAKNLQTELAPLGARILDVANQRLPALIAKVNSAIDRFSKLPPGIQQTAVELGLLTIAAGPVIQSLGSIVQLAGAAGNLIGVFGNASRSAGGLAALLSSGLNPAVLVGTGFVIAAGAAWIEYGRQAELSANLIANAVAKAKNEQSKLGKDVQLPDGSSLKVLPDRDLKIDTSGIKGPKFKLPKPTASQLSLQAQVLSQVGGENAQRQLQENQTNFFLSQIDSVSKSGGKQAKRLTELQQLTKELKETNLQIERLKQASSPEYRLKLKIEDAQEGLRLLEEILRARRELGEPVAGKIVNPAGELARLRGELRFQEGVRELKLDDSKLQRLENEARAIEQLQEQLAEASAKLTDETFAENIVRSQNFKLLQQTQPTLAALIRTQAESVDTTRQQRDTVKLFDVALAELNGKLEANRTQTELQAINLRVATGEYAKFSEAQREALRNAASQVDAEERARVAADKHREVLDLARQQYEGFVGTLENVFQDSFEKGPKAFYDQWLAYTKRTLSRILAEFAAANLSRVFSPASNGSATAGQQSGGGGLLGGLLNAFRPQSAGGGFNFGNLGLGPGGTAPFNPASATTGTQAGGFRGLLNQFSGFQLFGARAAAATPQTIGGLPVLPNVAIPGLRAPAGAPSITGVGTTAASAATPSLLASLGGAGLLAGGGLLGSLAGGKSPTGRLLGGLGGTLGAGFLGASGVFGAGIQAALPALLSNPATAVVAGALVGTALIVRLLANRDLKKLSNTIKEVHQLEVPTKGEGLGILQNVKKIGQETYGKRWLDQRADLVKQPTVIDLLTQYAIGTNQSSSPLVKAKRLADPFNEQNNFVRRLNGGPIPGPTLGRDYVPALLDGNEYVSAARTVQREGIASFAALNSGAATIVKAGGGDAMAAELRGLRDEFRAMHASLVYELRTVASATSRLGLASPGTVVMAGLHEQPGALDEPLSRAFRSGNLYKFTEDIIGR